MNIKGKKQRNIILQVRKLIKEALNKSMRELEGALIKLPNENIFFNLAAGCRKNFSVPKD